MNKWNDIDFNWKRDILKRGLKPQVEDKSATYEFQVAAHLSSDWAEWFDGLEIHYDGQGNTLLRGVIADQSELHGIIHKIRDLNMILISIVRK